MTRMMSQTALGVCILSWLCLAGETLQAEDDSSTELSEKELAFVELLSNADLVGTFTVDGREGAPQPERYNIRSVSKREGNQWTVQATIQYGEFNVPVPVPVQVDWAGDTPILSVTNLSLPLLGEGFTSRVLFYGDRYAGTWQHGPVGGHMFGRIEPRPRAESNDSE